jgi:glutathione synthase/RimK-type ligase-like ATP-grasp enzyme
LIIISHPDDWSAPTLPLEQRMAAAPPDLLAHLAQVNGYPAQAVLPAPDFCADVAQALAGLPDIVKQRLQDSFLGVYFVTNAGSSAATDIVVSADGVFHGIAIILDIDAVASRSANDWASWRENMPFAKGPYRVAVRIAGDAGDNRQNAIQFLLLHEIGHALSAGRGLIPDWWLPPEEIGAADAYAFLPISWHFDAAGHAAPHQRNQFPQREQLDYYHKALLPDDAILPCYRQLLNTDFFTLYASLSPDEDFAESFALYVHTELLQKPYFVRIYEDNRLLLQHASQWDEPRFAAKRTVLRRLLPDLVVEARQPFAPLIGVSPLMRRAFREEDIAPLATALVERAEANPQDAHAFLDCSTALQLTGHRELALAVQAEAIRLQQHYRLPLPALAPALRLLVIMGPGDLMANTPIEFLLEESDVALELFYVSDELPLPSLESLPPHDVLMVAVAESDANKQLLARLADWLKEHPTVLNRPEKIARLSRNSVCGMLAAIGGLYMPRTARITRAQLVALNERPASLAELLPDASFPLIVRPIGSHAGHDLEKVDSASMLAAYLERVNAEGFYLSPFVDYRSADGTFRKYRVALIEGQAFVCHYAISSHWMVHYLNAGMQESAEKRALEAECMAHFDQTFARQHAAALVQIDQRIGLPYLGIDCAEMPDGQLLIFEVDNAMIVHAMDDEQMYPYKKPAMQKVFTAFRRLLTKFAPPPATPASPA